MCYNGYQTSVRTVYPPGKPRPIAYLWYRSRNIHQHSCQTPGKGALIILTFSLVRPAGRILMPYAE